MNIQEEKVSLYIHQGAGFALDRVTPALDLAMAASTPPLVGTAQVWEKGGGGE